MNQENLLKGRSMHYSVQVVLVALLFILQGALSFNANAQGGLSVGSSTVRVNWGLDADLYANQVQFPAVIDLDNGTVGSLPVSPWDTYSDDWFNPVPNFVVSLGIGTIDTNGVAAFRA